MTIGILGGMCCRRGCVWGGKDTGGAEKVASD